MFHDSKKAIKTINDMGVDGSRDGILLGRLVFLPATRKWRRDVV